MRHFDFSIGTEFRCGDRLFRCTDVGSRIVTAIRVDGVEVSTMAEGIVLKSFLAGDKAEEEGWFNGPPYSVLEMVFDEDDFEGCEPT